MNIEMKVEIDGTKYTLHRAELPEDYARAHIACDPDAGERIWVSTQYGRILKDGQWLPANCHPYGEELIAAAREYQRNRPQPDIAPQVPEKPMRWSEPDCTCTSGRFGGVCTCC